MNFCLDPVVFILVSSFLLSCIIYLIITQSLSKDKLSDAEITLLRKESRKRLIIFLTSFVICFLSLCAIYYYYNFIHPKKEIPSLFNQGSIRSTSKMSSQQIQNLGNILKISNPQQMNKRLLQAQRQRRQQAISRNKQDVSSFIQSQIPTKTQPQIPTKTQSQKKKRIKKKMMALLDS